MGRNDADFVRPRLFTKDDPERRDDVSLLLDALDRQLSEKMAEGDKDQVEHITTLRGRIREAGGARYLCEGDDD